jgi:hypothetical protein
VDGHAEIGILRVQYPSGARYGIYTAYSAAVIKWFFWLLINTSIIVERME